MTTGKQSANFRQNMLVVQTTSASTVAVTHGDIYKVFASTFVGTATYNLPQALPGAGPFYWSEGGITTLVSLQPSGTDSVGSGNAGVAIPLPALAAGNTIFFGIFCVQKGVWTPINGGVGSLIPTISTFVEPFSVSNNKGVVGFDVVVNETLSGAPLVMGSWFSGGAGQAAVAIDIGNVGIMAYPNSGTNAGGQFYVIINGYYNGTNYITKNAGGVSLWYGDAQGNPIQIYDSPAVAAGAVATISNRWAIATGGSIIQTVSGAVGTSYQLNGASTVNNIGFLYTGAVSSSTGFYVNGTYGTALYSNNALTNAITMNNSGTNWGSVGNTGTNIWGLGLTTGITVVATTANCPILWGGVIGAQTVGFYGTTPVSQVTGFGTPVGAAVVASYNITDAGGANSNTNKCVAEILTVLKRVGLIGA